MFSDPYLLYITLATVLVGMTVPLQSENVPTPVIKCHQAWPSSSAPQGKPSCRRHCLIWLQNALSIFQMRNPMRKTLSPNQSCQHCRITCMVWGRSRRPVPTMIHMVLRMISALSLFLRARIGRSCVSMTYKLRKTTCTASVSISTRKAF